MNESAMNAFKEAFSQGSGVSIATWSLSIRFLAAILICIAAVMVVSHFINGSHKESDSFLLDISGLGIKLFIGLCFSLVFLLY